MGLNALRLRGGAGAAQAPAQGGILCEGAQVLFPQGILWDATSYVAGGVGRVAPQIKALTTHTLFSEDSCPKGCNLGLNALRLRGGCGGGASPPTG